MASITIRRLDVRTKERLRAQASRHGRSMEEEAREILTIAVAAHSPVAGNLAEAIHRRFAALGASNSISPLEDRCANRPTSADD